MHALSNVIPFSDRPIVISISRAASEGGVISGFDSVFTHTHTQICMYVCMYVCVCVCVYIYIYTLYMKRRHAETNSYTDIPNLFFSRFHHGNGFLSSRLTGAVHICISLWKTDTTSFNKMQRHFISQI